MYYYVVLSHVVLCGVMLYYVVLSYVILFYVVLCYVVLCFCCDAVFISCCVMCGYVELSHGIVHRPICSECYVIL